MNTGVGALVKTDPHDLVQPGGGAERPAVVELDPDRHPVAGPQRMQRAEHGPIVAVEHDLDPGVVGGQIDLVERVEAHPAVQAPRANQIDLRHIPGPLGGRCRVREALAGSAAWTLALGRTGARDDPLDRPLGRNDRAELLKLPGDRRRADLRPRVLLQTRSHLEHPRLGIRGGAARHPLGRARATLRPGRVMRVIARRPLRHPLPRPAQITGDRPRRLARQPPTRRLPTRRDLRIFHPNLPRSINTSAPASNRGRMETMCWRLNRQPRKRSVGGYR
jgi:hypothetical protein